jgi:hypothetical protein
MNMLKQWFAAHTISAKSVAAAWVFVDALFYASQPFHDYVTNAYNALPKGVHGFLAGVIIPAFIFWRSQKKAAQVPNA